MDFQVHFWIKYGKLESNSLHFRWKRKKSTLGQLMASKVMGMTLFFQRIKCSTGHIACFSGYNQWIKESFDFGQTTQLSLGTFMNNVE